jgi:hypothetical protein
MPENKFDLSLAFYWSNLSEKRHGDVRWGDDVSAVQAVWSRWRK